jgi:ubiquinone/menaquinone biosynthesis C-methylase UbiE
LDKDERQIAEWYNILSGSYDELYGKEQSEKYQAVLEFLGNRRFKVLVDIGCGTGTFLAKTDEIYHYAIGIDLSIKMLRIAMKTKTLNIDYILASSSWLPLRDDSSDCTVSVSTAKAESNLPMFMAELERISHKASVLAFSLFQPSRTSIQISLPKTARSAKLSELETIYFLPPAEDEP